MGLKVWAPIKLKNRQFSGWNFECDDKKNCKAANFSSIDMVAFTFYVSLQEYLKRNVYLSLSFFRSLPFPRMMVATMVPRMMPCPPSQ